MNNLVSLELAQEVYAETIKGVPDLPLPKLGYPQDSETGANGEKLYCVVWENEGYNPECAYLNQQQTVGGYITDMWPQMVTTEFKTAQANHQKAEQYGLPEGIQWIFVESGV